MLPLVLLQAQHPPSRYPGVIQTDRCHEDKRLKRQRRSPFFLPADLPLGQPLLARSSGNRASPVRFSSAALAILTAAATEQQQRPAHENQWEEKEGGRGKMSQTPNKDEAGMSVLLLQSNVIVFHNDGTSPFYYYYYFFILGKLKKVGGSSLQGVDVFSPAQLWSLTTAWFTSESREPSQEKKCQQGL